MVNNPEKSATDACCSACASTARNKPEDAHAVAHSLGDGSPEKRGNLDALALRRSLPDQPDQLSPEGERRKP